MESAGWFESTESSSLLPCFRSFAQILVSLLSSAVVPTGFLRNGKENVPFEPVRPSSNFL